MSENDIKALLAAEGECGISLFQKQEVRKVMYQGEWWFSVNDVIEALVDATDGADYLKKLRQRDEGLKEGWGQIVTPLPFATLGGIQSTNFINIEGIFRLMQSVSSKKAEPFKKWLAKVGFERLQEAQNPELAVKRAMALYKAKGYDDAWIELRIQNRISREQLEEEWKQRGVTRPQDYALLTDAISVETFGITTKKHKAVKGLRSQSLRDNMTPIELTLTTLGEQATKEIATSTDAKNYYQNLMAAKSGGSIAGQARMGIEAATKKNIVSPENYLKTKKKSEVLPELEEVKNKIKHTP